MEVAKSHKSLRKADVFCDQLFDVKTVAKYLMLLDIFCSLKIQGGMGVNLLSRLHALLFRKRPILVELLST